VIAAIAAHAVAAEDPAATHLSFHDALERALKVNNDIERAQALWAEYKARKAATTMAR